MYKIHPHIIYIAYLAWLGACRDAPNHTRSSVKSRDIYRYIVADSVDFRRGEDKTSGTLTLTLKDDYNCAIEFWSADPNTTPNETSPSVRLCPENQMNISLSYGDLEASIPYIFKISLWPKSLSSANAVFIIINEAERTSQLAAKHLVLHNYNSPRQTGEIYTFLQQDQFNLQQLRETFLRKYALDQGHLCGSKPFSPQLPYIRSQSLEDPQKRPLHGLGKIATTGYGLSTPTVHSYYKTRLISNVETINRLKNWNWQFTWEDQNYEFTTYPPAYIQELHISSANSDMSFSNRELQGVLPTYPLTDVAPTIDLKAIFPGQINFVHIDIKDPYRNDQALFCTYLYQGQPFTIPLSNYKNLGPGTYDFTVTLESIDIHAKSEPSYPPWVLSNQDWIHGKVKKVI